jgi:hypothetical protein
MQPHWSQLSFELDGVDVTAMVVRTAGGAQIAMPMPLTQGEHELRVVFAAPNGSLVEWGRWAVRIVGEPVWNAQADSVLTLDGQVYKHGALVQNAQHGVQAEGATQLRVQRDAEGFDLRARTDLWLNTRREADSGDTTADVGEYLVEVDAGPAQLRLGHHRIDYDSMIYSEFARRGLSGRVALNDLTSVSGFAVRSEPQAGANDITGLSQEDHRVAGLVYEHKWGLDDGRGLSMTAAMASGKGNDLQDAIQAGNEPLHSGQVWSLAGDASWNHERLRLHAELAGSVYNWNNQVQGDVDKGRESDKAHAMSIDWLPEPVGDGSAWTFGFDHRVVGTFFRSVSYLGLASDLAMNRWRASWRSGPWLASGNYLMQHSNANDLPDLPSIGMKQVDGFFSWAPVLEGERPWYGQPSLSLNLSQVRQHQRSTPANFIGTKADSRQWQTGLNAMFDHGSWSTSFGVGRGAYTDVSLPSFSSTSRTLNWSAYARLGEHWTLGPQVEWSRLVTLLEDQRQIERTASLFTDFAFIPDRFMGNLNMGVNLSRRSFDSQRESNRFAVGELIWRLKKARLNRPGWDMRLSYSLQDFEDVLDPTRSGRGNQVFLGVTMTLAAATQH